MRSTYNMQPVLGQRDEGDTRTVSVCANCLPGDTLFVAFPWLKGNVQLSHGICRVHSQLWLDEIEIKLSGSAAPE